VGLFTKPSPIPTPSATVTHHVTLTGECANGHPLSATRDYTIPRHQARNFRTTEACPGHGCGLSTVLNGAV
jgi:hypothetical protein